MTHPLLDILYALRKFRKRAAARAFSLSDPTDPFSRYGGKGFLYMGGIYDRFDKLDKAIALIEDIMEEKDTKPKKLTKLTK